MSKALKPTTPEEEKKCDLIEKLLANEILHSELIWLRKRVDADDLSLIIQKIYDLNETYIHKLATVEKMIEKMNQVKNAQRNQVFFKKIRKRFRDLNNKKHITVLAEGDSWFNYPIILTDIIDRINMEKDLAVYSIASGGDWLLNMLDGRQYVEELSIIHPDWFLISGGGNDLVGSRRLATILQPDGKSVEFEKSEWAQHLIDRAEKTAVPLKDDFFDGLAFLSKDFYALLMFFHLQYYFLLGGILKDDGITKPKFDGIRIITQGYDYPLPSFDTRFGLNPIEWYVPFIRKFLGHGDWLKGPLQIRGINDPEHQRKVLYSMIYLFNEMMIEIGTLFNESRPQPRMFHIDSRDSVGEKGWADELHPRPVHFIKTGQTFIDCIKQQKQPTYGSVFVVKNCNP